jgi:hypothetical protein
MTHSGIDLQLPADTQILSIIYVLFSCFSIASTLNYIVRLKRHKYSVRSLI